MKKVLLLVIVCCLWQMGFGQVNLWTWMKGDNVTSAYSFYGVKGISDVLNTPGGRGTFEHWTDNDGNFWLFGGYANTTSNNYDMLNDLWKYNVKTNEWMWVKGDSIYQSEGFYGIMGVSSIKNNPRARFLSTSWRDDSGSFWLFGGQKANGGLNNGVFNDLWKYDPLTNEWLWVRGDSTIHHFCVYGVKGVSSPTNQIGSRSASMSWTDTSGNFWIFGGSGEMSSSSSNLNDLWRYNPHTNEWTWMKGDSTGNQPGVYGTLNVPSMTNNPGSRIHASTWTDNSNNLWLYGGRGYSTGTSNGLLNDIWMYQISTNQWVWVGTFLYGIFLYGV